jgi:hypothetical protein
VIPGMKPAITWSTELLRAESVPTRPHKDEERGVYRV